MSSASFPILLIGRAQQMSMEQMYLRAFQANGYRDIDLLDIEAHRPAWSRNRLVNRFVPAFGHAWAGQRLLTHLRGCSDRYRWIIIFKGMEFSRHVLEECRKLAPSVLWLNINPDDPYNVASRGASNSNVLESLSFFNAYCIWSRSIADRLRADGCNRVIYLPFGYDETYHVPHETPSQTDPPFTLFFGAWDKEREAVLAQLTGYNVIIHGARWERANRAFPLRSGVSRPYAFGAAIAPIVASSAVCLNLLRPQNCDAHNMRTFEIPAMGGLLLTGRSAEQQEFFPENEACYMYADIAELKTKIDYILANKQEADRVRARGMELVRGHSLANRARFILSELT